MAVVFDVKQLLIVSIGRRGLCMGVSSFRLPVVVATAAEYLAGALTTMGRVA